jgi:hypothetical protein
MLCGELHIDIDEYLKKYALTGHVQAAGVCGVWL